MSKVSKNLLTTGLSGMFGGQIVFRTVNGKTIAAAPPGEAGEPTQAQSAIRDRFYRATQYAKNAVKDAVLKLLYESKAADGKSPYNVVVADYFNAPIIQQIDTADYSGAVGDTISILASDDVEIKSVFVEIREADNSLLETGEAVRLSSGSFRYTATTVNAAVSGGKVVVRVSDHPGNVTVEE